MRIKKQVLNPHQSGSKGLTFHANYTLITNQDLRNFDRITIYDMRILKKTQTVSWHKLTVYATKEQRA